MPEVHMGVQSAMHGGRNEVLSASYEPSSVFLHSNGCVAFSHLQPLSLSVGHGGRKEVGEKALHTWSASTQIEMLSVDRKENVGYITLYSGNTCKHHTVTAHQEWNRLYYNRLYYNRPKQTWRTVQWSTVISVSVGMWKEMPLMFWIIYVVSLYCEARKAEACNSMSKHFFLLQTS
jgi:hypothetical protein